MLWSSHFYPTAFCSPRFVKQIKREPTEKEVDFEVEKARKNAKKANRANVDPFEENAVSRSSTVAVCFKSRWVGSLLPARAHCMHGSTAATGRMLTHGSRASIVNLVVTEVERAGGACGLPAV